MRLSAVDIFAKEMISVKKKVIKKLLIASIVLAMAIGMATTAFAARGVTQENGNATQESGGNPSNPQGTAGTSGNRLDGWNDAMQGSIPDSWGSDYEGWLNSESSTSGSRLEGWNSGVPGLPGSWGASFGGWLDIGASTSDSRLEGWNSAMAGSQPENWNSAYGGWLSGGNTAAMIGEANRGGITMGSQPANWGSAYDGWLNVGGNAASNKDDSWLGSMQSAWNSSIPEPSVQGNWSGDWLSGQREGWGSNWEATSQNTLWSNDFFGSKKNEWVQNHGAVGPPEVMPNAGGPEMPGWIANNATNWGQTYNSIAAFDPFSAANPFPSDGSGSLQQMTYDSVPWSRLIAQTLGRGQVQREAIAAQEARNAGYLQNHTDATNAWRDFYYDELGDPVGAMEQKVDDHIVNKAVDAYESYSEKAYDFGGRVYDFFTRNRQSTPYDPNGAHANDLRERMENWRLGP